MVARVSPSRRANLLIVAIQIGTSGVSFLAWAAVSRLAVTSDAVLSAYAIGMILYMPLSLGLPYTLPNLFRASEDPEALAVSRQRARLFQRLIAAIFTGSAILGMVLAFSTTDSSALTGLALALCLAAGLGLGTTLQQLARIRGRVGIMVLASCASICLPAFWFLSSLLGIDVAAMHHVTAVALGAVALGFALVVARLAPASERLDPAPARFSTLALIAKSATIVPHLLAFSALMQGLRVIMALRGAPSAELESAHYISLFLNIGFVFISSMHSILAVRMQTAQSSAAVIAPTARKYALLGALSSVGVMVAVGTPIRLAFADFDELSPETVALLGLVPGIMCAYYFLSTLSLREFRGGRLAFISVTALAAWLFLGYRMPLTGVEPFVPVFVACLAVMPVLLLGVTLITRTLPPGLLARSAGVALLGCVPGLGLLAVALVA